MWSPVEISVCGTITSCMTFLEIETLFYGEVFWIEGMLSNGNGYGWWKFVFGSMWGFVEIDGGDREKVSCRRKQYRWAKVN